MEVWKDIPGYEGQYQVSDQGRVKSLPRDVRLVTRGIETTRRVIGCVLRPSRSTRGYVTVSLGFRNTKVIHLLVLAAFIGKRAANEVSRHHNGDRSDNRLANLYYQEI